MEPFDFDSAKEDLNSEIEFISDYEVMSYALYPKVAKDFLKFKSQYGPVDKLETRHFLLDLIWEKSLRLPLRRARLSPSRPSLLALCAPTLA
jgi:pyruvate carboxylase